MLAKLFVATLFVTMFTSYAQASTGACQGAIYDLIMASNAQGTQEGLTEALLIKLAKSSHPESDELQQLDQHQAEVARLKGETAKAWTQARNLCVDLK